MGNFNRGTASYSPPIERCRRCGGNLLKSWNHKQCLQCGWEPPTKADVRFLTYLRGYHKMKVVTK